MHTSIDSKHMPILLVEDNEEDYEATMRAFRKVSLDNVVHRCVDGDDALDFLHKRGAYADRSAESDPGLILLDLNMPGTDGREVLAQVKSDPKLCMTPVVILTTSHDPRDIEDCYRAGANSYVAKPMSLDGFVDAMHSVKDYWLQLTCLPSRREA